MLYCSLVFIQYKWLTGKKVSISITHFLKKLFVLDIWWVISVAARRHLLPGVLSSSYHHPYPHRMLLNGEQFNSRSLNKATLTVATLHLTEDYLLSLFSTFHMHKRGVFKEETTQLVYKAFRIYLFPRGKWIQRQIRKKTTFKKGVSMKLSKSCRQ